MLMIIAIILIFLWALGLVTSTTLGGIIHIMFMAAVIIVVVKEIWDREIT